MILRRLLCFLLFVAPLFSQTSTTTQPAGGNGTGGTPAFGAVTPGTNTGALGIGTGGTLIPSGTGQITSNLQLSQVTPATPILTGALTGGTFGTGATAVVALTYNIGALESMIGTFVSFQLNAGNNCASGSTCSITVTAPTLPSGFTGYTVYDLTGGALPYFPLKRQTALAACVNITTNCVIGTLGTGANAPTSSTIVTAPSPLAPSICPGGTPWLYTYDPTANNWQDYGYIDTSVLTAGSTPLIKPKLGFCGPVYINDTGAMIANAPAGLPGGIGSGGGVKNCLLCIDHESGRTTGTNGSGVDDRALGIRIDNDATVNPTYEEYLGEYDEAFIDNNNFVCNPLSTEVCAASIRGIIADYRTTPTTAPTAGAGIVGVSGHAFRQGTMTAYTSCTFCFRGVSGVGQDSGSGNLGSLNFVGVYGASQANGTSTNGQGVGVVGEILARFGSVNYGVMGRGAGTNINDWALYAVNNLNLFGAGASGFEGPIVCKGAGGGFDCDLRTARGGGSAPGNTDLAGTIAVTASTTGTYSFKDTSNTVGPLCTVTPTSDPTATGVYWVTSTSTTLTVTVKTSGTITFNYLCVALN